MKKESAVLFGPAVGELYWEAARFVPHFIWKKRKQLKSSKDVKFIVFTRPERFDLYGLYSDILVPLRIEGDGKDYIPNCFRMDNFPQNYFDELVIKFRENYASRFNILEHIYPKVDKQHFQMKYQFQRQQMDYKYFPRRVNYDLVEKNIPKDKQLISLAPRYRNGLRRNWKRWQEFYDLLYNSDLRQKYNFVICGKDPDYVPDMKKRFYDVNYLIDSTLDASSIGIVIEVLKRSILTIGSQSGIPNISLLIGTPAIEFGHQKRLHTVDYNIRKTKVHFIDDPKYQLSPETLLEESKKFLKQLGGTNK